MTFVRSGSRQKLWDLSLSRRYSIGGTAIPPTKEQRERLKEWLELADDADDVRGYGIDSGCRCGGIRHGHSTALWGMGHVGETYHRGDTTCHLHVSLESRGANPHAYILCIGYQ